MPHSTPAPVKKIIKNPVTSRDDLVNLLYDLLTPLQTGQSDGGARIRIGHTGTHFDQVAAELEGYARALWGLAPLLAADPENPKFAGLREAWVRGLDNGTNPEHEEYWGDHIDRDQRFVEMAAIVSFLSSLKLISIDYRVSLWPSPRTSFGHLNPQRPRSESIIGFFKPTVLISLQTIGDVGTSSSRHVSV
jgi:hypothetical protein